MTANDDPQGFAQCLNIGMYANKLRNFQRAQRPFWLFYNQCCGNCQFGGFVENILEDVTLVREGDRQGPHPHIILDRGDREPLGLYFSNGSPTPADVLAYSAAYRIDLFVLVGTAPPLESFVLDAHIRPQTCRTKHRERLRDLWNHIARIPDPHVGIIEDFRSEKRKAQEALQRDRKWRNLRQAIEAGTLRCARCNYQFEMEGDGFSYSSILTHREDGKCAEQTPFCRNCSFEVMGSWNREFPDDADSWVWREDCPSCQEAKRLNQARIDAMPVRPFIEVPTSYGSRRVHGPQLRTQSYVVGEHHVTKNELQAILMTFEYLLRVILPDLLGDQAWSQTTCLQLSHLDEIQDAILYPNNIRDWDWLRSVEDKVVSGNPHDTGSKQDRLFFPKRWWQELPPYPLDYIPALQQIE